MLTTFCSVRKFINDENWYHRLNRARHLEPHARFVKPACIHSRQMDVSQSPSSNASEDPQLALYVCFKSSIRISTLTYNCPSLPTLVVLISQVSLFDTVLTRLASLGYIPQPDPTAQSSRRPTKPRPIQARPRPNLKSKPGSPTHLDLSGLRAPSALPPNTGPVRISESALDYGS
jgi:hypothetical protein